MAFHLVKIEPTLAAAAMSAGDVLFDSTEFKLPARCCRLVSVVLVDYKKKFVADDVEFIFHKDNAGGTFGTSGAAEALSSANAKLNVPIGYSRVEGESFGQFANFTMAQSTLASASNDETASGSVILERDHTDQKIYVMGRIDAVSTAGTPAGTNADGAELCIYLGFES